MVFRRVCGGFDEVLLSFRRFSGGFDEVLLSFRRFSGGFDEVFLGHYPPVSVQEAVLVWSSDSYVIAVANQPKTDLNRPQLQAGLRHLSRPGHHVYT